MNKIIKRVSRLFSQFEKTEMTLKRKKRTNYIRKYEAIPDNLRIQPRDPFDYPLRVKEEVMKDLEIKPILPHTYIVTHSLEPNQHLAKKLSRKVTFKISIEDLNFLTEK